MTFPGIGNEKPQKAIVKFDPWPNSCTIIAGNITSMGMISVNINRWTKESTSIGKVSILSHRFNHGSEWVESQRTLQRQITRL